MEQSHDPMGSSGRVTNTAGGTGFFNMQVRQNGTENRSFTDDNGNYELKCLRSGTYEVDPIVNNFSTPSYGSFINSGIAWPFNTSNSITVTLNGSDITGQTF